MWVPPFPDLSRLSYTSRLLTVRRAMTVGDSDRPTNSALSTFT